MSSYLRYEGASCLPFPLFVTIAAARTTYNAAVNVKFLKVMWRASHYHGGGREVISGGSGNVATVCSN